MGEECLINEQHRKRKRVLADRYAMTNIMRKKPLAAIRERAQTFVSECTSAAGASVDVYVWDNIYTYSDPLSLTITGFTPLLRARLRHSFHVQSPGTEIVGFGRRLEDHGGAHISPESPEYTSLLRNTSFSRCCILIKTK